MEGSLVKERQSKVAKLELLCCRRCRARAWMEGDREEMLYSRLRLPM